MIIMTVYLKIMIFQSNTILFPYSITRQKNRKLSYIVCGKKGAFLKGFKRLLIANKNVCTF